MPGATPISATRSDHHGVIDVRVTDLAQLFNSLDPTPFPEKDLDEDAEEFIVSWARELHAKAPFLVRVHVAGGVCDGVAHDRVRDTIRVYFTHRAEMMRLKLRQLMSVGRVSLIIGVAFLAGCILLADLVGRAGQGAFIDIVQSSLIIGGWVAMWRPIEILLYDWWPLLREERIFKRLSNAEVELVPASSSARSP